MSTALPLRFTACLLLSVAASAITPRAAAADTKGAALAARPAQRAAARPAVTPGADEARSFFEQGIAAHDAGKLDLAEELFTRAWEKKRSWDIAANLGIVERKRGEHLRAAEHLSFALAALPPSEADTTREGIQRELAAVLPMLGRLSIRSNVDGAEVRVGGRVKGTTPLDGPVLVAPGVVLVEVRKDGYETRQEYVRAAAGAATDTTLSLSPKPAHEDGSLTGPLVAFAFGGAGLVTGAVATGISVAEISSLKGACGDDLVCPAGARDKAEIGRAAGHVATVGFAMAGVGAAVGITLLALPAAQPSSARVGVTVGPSFVGLKGAF